MTTFTKIALGVLGAGLIFFLCVYFKQFHGSLEGDATRFGVFGDYVGGTIGSLVGLVSVIFLYETLKSQNKALEEQRKAAIIQSFEPSFFSMLSIQREILKGLKGHVSTYFDGLGLIEESEGQEYMDEVKTAINNLVNSFFKDKFLNPNDSIEKKTKEVGRLYMQVFKGKEAQLGHYFRHLYYIMRYVDESEVENKKKYIDIIQAQMSDSELYVGFYSGFSELAYEKFLPLADKYQFFRNVRSTGIHFESHKDFYPKTTFDHKNNHVPL